jgi:hypothetical protein
VILCNCQCSGGALVFLVKTEKTMGGNYQDGVSFLEEPTRACANPGVVGLRCMISKIAKERMRSGPHDAIIHMYSIASQEDFSTVIRVIVT